MKDLEVTYQGIDRKYQAAILEWTSPSQLEPRRFLINEASLIHHIKSVKERGGDASQEELALKALEKIPQEEYPR